MYNVFIAIEKKKVTKEKTPSTLWPNATKHGSAHCATLWRNLVLHHPGTLGSFSPPPIPPSAFLVALNLSSAKVMCPGVREAPGLGREKGWAETAVSGTGDFRAVLGKLIGEVALSKGRIRGHLGGFDDQQTLRGQRGKHGHRIHFRRKPRRSTELSHLFLFFHIAQTLVFI